ncbi:hypothetical protein XU18_3360 [Perkinsela sp. CCAP 1560/4]|nr:hypothetical protein XU18_3360 [Perkinsela sp. CCAP 1560/4]|eukprot:KNH05589.1 hypothetical protein XU18_3360 [Perkinsela sp. CCAP 1560/4]
MPRDDAGERPAQKILYPISCPSHFMWGISFPYVMKHKKNWALCEPFHAFSLLAFAEQSSIGFMNSDLWFVYHCIATACLRYPEFTTKSDVKLDHSLLGWLNLPNCVR